MTLVTAGFGEQAVSVKLNGQPFLQFKTTWEDSLHVAPLPLEKLRTNNVLTFHIPNAKPNKDGFSRGLRVHSLRIEPDENSGK